jgi:hypothetical protein
MLVVKCIEEVRVVSDPGYLPGPDPVLAHSD